MGEYAFAANCPVAAGVKCNRRPSVRLEVHAVSSLALVGMWRIAARGDGLPDAGGAAADEIDIALAGSGRRSATAACSPPSPRSGGPIDAPLIMSHAGAGREAGPERNRCTNTGAARGENTAIASAPSDSTISA